MPSPISKTATAQIDWYPIASGTIRKGMTCTVSSGNAAESTGTDIWGIALDDADYSNIKKRGVRLHRLGAGIVPVLCSDSLSAGATVQPATDGVAALTVGGATTMAFLVGRLVEAGAAGGLAGCDVSIATQTMA